MAGGGGAGLIFAGVLGVVWIRGVGGWLGGGVVGWGIGGPPALALPLRVFCKICWVAHKHPLTPKLIRNLV